MFQLLFFASILNKFATSGIYDPRLRELVEYMSVPFDHCPLSLQLWQIVVIASAPDRHLKSPIVSVIASELFCASQSAKQPLQSIRISKASETSWKDRLSETYLETEVYYCSIVFINSYHNLFA